MIKLKLNCMPHKEDLHRLSSCQKASFVSDLAKQAPQSHGRASITLHIAIEDMGLLPSHDSYPYSLLQGKHIRAETRCSGVSTHSCFAVVC